MELKPCNIKEFGLKALPLLIVPYGIETNKELKEEELRRTFNRTLWN